jgi:signal transduction histidine kinase
MSGAAEALRAERRAIAAAWETQVLADVPELSVLSRTMLIDHFPEFIEGLAAWLDGVEQEGFRALTDGHAISRQRAGIPIDVLLAEYSTLRRVIIDAVGRHIAPAEVAAVIASLNAGMDVAMNDAVRRYVLARDEVRERFVAMLGHDLRDPLAVVQMSAAVLAVRPLPEPDLAVVRQIKTASDRMERMITDVLDFARGRLSGGIPVKPELADMAEICRLAVEEANATGKLPIAIDTSGDLSGAFDRDRIRQALSNLLRNAQSYGGGQIEVRAWESDDRKKIFTTVTNHGPMIPPEQLVTLFDPFKRATDAHGGGLGLGLYIVSEIARAHGAVCSAQSSAEATVFSIEWPRIPFEDTPNRPV